MNYEQCQRYLEEIQNLGIKFGLENVKTVLTSLGNPQEKYTSLLVGGSNGKGSVCAILTSILSNHGFCVGLYTSPHLVKVEERVRVGLEPISSPDFCQELTLVRENIEELIRLKKLYSPPTYFELLTCLALHFFKQQKVDIAILEVGMGGRFDATNVVTPYLSLITTVSKDHQRFLGKTLSKIAFEKAGIVKPGVPVVCGVKKGSAQTIIKEKAREVRAPFYDVFDQKRSFLGKRVNGRYSFIYKSGKEIFRFSPSLQGRHQGKNAAMAIAAAELLSKNWKKLEKKKIIQGIESARWEGRLEILSHRPLVILDGTHNEEGARALRNYIQEFIRIPLILVVAFKREKAIKKVANILFPLAKKIVITRFPYSAADPEDIKAQSFPFRDKIVIEPDVKLALEIALSDAGENGCVLITGSLFLAGEVKKIFLSEKSF